MSKEIKPEALGDYEIERRQNTIYIRTLVQSLPINTPLSGTEKEL